MRRFLTLLLAFTALARAVPPPLPQPATSFGAAMADGWLYVYGGNSGNAHEFHRDSIKGDFLRVRVPDGTEWEKLPGDIALLGAAMDSARGKVYRVGGLEARNAKGEPNDLHSSRIAVRFDPKSATWEPLPDLPQPRSSHDIVIVGDTLYVAGGWSMSGADGDGTHTEWHKTLLSLDLRAPESGWKSVPQNFERRALAVAEHGGRLWFLGGMGPDGEPSKEVDWFDLKTGEWGKGPDLPGGGMAGFGMAACSAGGRLLASPLSGKLYALSADAKSWEEMATLARPRFFHRLLPLADGRLIAVGGSNRQGQIKELELVSLDAKGAAPADSPAREKPTSAADVKHPTESNAGQPWPQWRGQNRDGISGETGWRKDWPADGPKQLWSAKVGAGMSSCSVADGRLFTQGNDGEDMDSVFAFDAATGGLLWRYSFPCASAAHEMPIVPSGPGATPTVIGGKVYVLSREGELVVLEADSGRLAWRRNLVKDLGGKRPVYGYSQSPLIEDGRLFLDVGAPEGESGSTVALDAATGELLWRAGKGEAGYSSARILSRDGKRYVAMFKGQALVLFDPADGRVLWSHPTTARDFTNAATPAFVGHRILVSNTGTDQATLLDWDSGSTPDVRPSWTQKQFALLFNSAIEFEGCLFGFNEKRRGHHEFTCLDAQTGEARWVSDAVPTSTFILADGHWIFLTREGEVVLAPASTAELKPTARFKAIEGKCYATPTLANSRLFVRNNEGLLAAFDLRPAGPSK